LVCEALRKTGVKGPIDVHLMVTPVDSLVADFAKAGADTLVSGSAIFGSADYAATIRAMRAQIELGRREAR
jgi:pentose-5-phosphate-3-epimerase